MVVRFGRLLKEPLKQEKWSKKLDGSSKKKLTAKVLVL